MIPDVVLVVVVVSVVLASKIVQGIKDGQGRQFEFDEF